MKAVFKTTGLCLFEFLIYLSTKNIYSIFEIARASATILIVKNIHVHRLFIFDKK